jgi:hypothetical protein
MTQDSVFTPKPSNFAPATVRHTRTEQPQEQINRFSGKLEQLQRRDSQQSREANKKPEKQNRDKPGINPPPAFPQKLGKTLVDEREARSESGISGPMMAILGARAKPAVVQSAPAEPPPAHLDRIAAAIAELSGKDIDMRFQLNLPFGTAQIDTALVGRDAMGRLTIQLACNSALPPETMAKMSSELARRLRERKLRVGDIGFGGSDQPVQQKHAGS